MKRYVSKLAVSSLLLIILHVLIIPGPSYVAAEDPEPGEHPTMSGAKGFGESDGGAGGGGASSVNFTGSASYSIPIVTPPGRLGVSPNISLTYSSQGGNGWIGVGWDFDLGSIRRSVKNGVDYTQNDFIYSKNGATSELVQVTMPDTPSQCFNEYRSKIEDGSFIRFCYTNSYGRTTPSQYPYWVAFDKNGTKYYLGAAESTIQNNPDNTEQIFQWKLDRIEDANGNYMTISYFKDSGQIYLDEIAYTGNSVTGLQAHNTVKFNRVTRNDTMTSYLPQFKVTTKYILDNIEMRSSGQLAGKYQLSYFQSERSLRSMLEEVTRIGADGATALPSTIFSYDQDVGFASMGTTIPLHLDDSYGTTDIARVKPGDFNGDGKTDFLYIGLTASQTKFYISNGNFFTTVNFPFSYFDNFSEPHWRNFYLNRFIFGDFNGDGKTDFIVLYTGALSHPSDLPDETQPNQLWLATVDSVTGALSFQQHTAPDFPKYTCTGDGVIQVWDNYPSRFKTGDFNGDGKTDILFIEGLDSHYHNSSIYFATGTGFSPPQASVPAVNLWAIPSFFCRANYELTNINSVLLDTIRVADFDGDGKSDIHYINGLDAWTDSTVYFSSSTGQNVSFQPAVGPSLFVTSNATDCNDSNGNTILRNYWGFFDLGRVRYGDFNGDGYTDILEIKMGEPSKIYYGTGNIAAPFEMDDGPFFSIDPGGDHPLYYNMPMIDLSRIKLGDFNGDGKTDFMRINGWGGSEASSIIVANGTGFNAIAGNAGSYFVSDGTYDNNNCSLRGTVDVNKFIMGDFHGSGKTGFLYFNGTPGNYTLSIRYPSVSVDLMREITLPAKGRVTFDYTPSSDFPNTQLPFSIPLLTSLTVFPEVENFEGVTGYASPPTETQYQYAEGYFDIEDREFGGFGYVMQINQDGSTLETWYHQRDEQDAGGAYIDDEDFKGKPYLMQFTEPWQNSPVPGQHISITSSIWSRSAPKGTYPVFVSIGDKYVDYKFNSTLQIRSREQFDYDNSNGTITRVVTSATDYTAEAGEVPSESITTDNVYDNYGFWLWRNTKTTVTGSTSGKVRETTYDYCRENDITDCAWTLGTLKWKEFWLQNGTNPRISYAYYHEGNLKSSTDAKNNLTSTIVYDSTNTYPHRVSNSLGHTVTTEYDHRFGTVTCTWDANENKTCTTPDPFGRPLETISYIGEGPSIAAKSKIMYSDVSSPAVLPRYTKTSVFEKNPYGLEIYIDRWDYIDGLGRGIETISFGENGKNVVSRTFYDTMGRPYLTEGPYFGDGIFFNQPPPPSYIGYPWTETEFDYLGRPKSITSPNELFGTVTSTIEYDGLKTKGTDPDGKVHEQKKDYMGRIIWVKEHADSGVLTTRYEYNAAGDMKKVTDAAGNITTIHYDTLGRKTDMTDPDMGYWQYRYDANGNLCKQADAKNQVILFEYDVLDRVVSKTYYSVTGPGQITDDCAVNGTTISTEYPVAYSYDDPAIPNGKGRLYRVSNTNVSSQVNEYDSFGRAVSATKTITGQSYTTLTGYDDAGRLESITYPDGYIVTYNYITGTELLQSVTGSDGTVFAGFSLYEATGKIGKIAFGNGASNEYTYDRWSSRLSKMVAKPASQTSVPEAQIFNMAYEMSGAGDISKMIDYKMGDTLNLFGNIFEYNYTYDNLHRLETETTTKVEQDNILRPTDIEYVAHPTIKHAFSQIIKNGDPFDFLYDSNGNMTSGYDLSNQGTGQAALRTIDYNADNMPIRVTNGGTQVDFLYDASGGRAKKAIGVDETYYVGKHYEVINNEPVKYIFAAGLRIAMIKGTPGAEETYYYHKDHLGSTIALTDVNGWVAWEGRYLPYGGFRKVSGALITNYLYTDQEFDPETSLYYYGARYYDPALGKFISPDSIIPNPFDPQTFNRYAYALNNPLRYVDPNGHNPIVVAFIVGVVVGAMVAGYNSHWDGRAMMQGGVIGGVCGVAGGAVGMGVSSLVSGYVSGAAGGTAGAVAGGAAGGATAGALGAFIAGGNIWEAALYGAIGGALGGAVGVAGYNGDQYVQFTFSVASAGVISGVMAELSGQAFSEGAIPGMMGAAISYTLNRYNKSKLTEGKQSGKRLGIHSNVLDKAAFDDGHAWITVTDKESGKITAYGLWPDFHTDTVDNGFGSDVRINMELGDTPLSSYYWNLTENQLSNLMTFINETANWEFTKTCADWAVDAVFNSVGQRIHVNDWLGFVTPRGLSQSIHGMY